MEDLLKYLSICIERGKVDKNFPYPPDLNGKNGASETTKRLLKDYWRRVYQPIESSQKLSL
ncbi:MAG: hypothetical protein H8E87_00640 [FCB group bacterium]|nr:hypothetical protein [FCB group bacterium]